MAHADVSGGIVATYCTSSTLVQALGVGVRYGENCLTLGKDWCGSVFAGEVFREAVIAGPSECLVLGKETSC